MIMNNQVDFLDVGSKPHKLMSYLHVLSGSEVEVYKLLVSGVMNIGSRDAAAGTSINYFNIASPTMAWTVGAWVLIATVLAVTADPLKTPTSNCIPQGSYCMDTIKPCCQKAVLQDDHVRHHECICFIFGQGLCQPFYEIPDVQLYVDLVRELNSTNYMELRRAYRRKLDSDPERELIDSRLLRSLMSDNDIATVFTDSSVNVSQMVRNATELGVAERARELTDTRGTPAQMVRNETETKSTDTLVTPAQMVRNDTAPTLTDFSVIPTQMVRHDAAIKSQQRSQPWVVKKPVPYLAPKAWTRYKCKGIDCVTEK